MDEKQLSEILKYSRSNEIYVVDQNGRLSIIKCPFQVKTLQAIGKLLVNQFYEVSEVKVTPKLVTIYMIGGSAYYYFHFEIQL